MVSDPYRQRRATDWNRLVAAVLIVTAAALHARHPTLFEQQLFRLVNTLPGGLRPQLIRLYRLATVWAFGVIVIWGLLARRWRLARDLLLAGLLAAVISRVLGLIIQDGIGNGLEVFVRMGTGPTFPLVRLSVATAVVAVAAPYLTRPARWLGRAALAIVAPGAIYLGLAYPNDVVAALALGWGVAAAVHLAFGSPAGRLTLARIAASLEELGVRARKIRLEDAQPEGATLLAAESADDARGPLRIKVLGRDEAEAQLFSKLWRSLLYKENGRMLQLTRLQEVEHEAYTVLVARNAGVRAPDVVAAGMAGPGAAILALCEPKGVRLSEIEHGLVSNELLAEIWRQAGLLHSARLVHGRLNANAVIVTPDGPALTHFDIARSTPAGASVAGDVAELLASLASVVGPERALASATAGAESLHVAPALPLLQPAALTPETKSALGSRKAGTDLLSRLREMGAAATGTAPPALQQLRRVSGANLLLAVGALLAVGGLLAAVGSPAQLAAATRHARWNWLAAAFAISMSTNVAYGVALLGTVTQRLPLWPTIELQVALSLSNVAVPMGGTAMQVRYLQHHGSDLATAIAAGGLLSTVGSAVAWGALLLVAVALSPHAIHVGNFPPGSLPTVALAVVLVSAVAAALVMGLPMLRRIVVPPVRHAASAVWDAVRSPRRLALLLGGNLVVALLLGVCLLACLVAFGAHVSFWTVLALNVAISGIAALVPIPGGGTALSAVGLSGALVAVGVPQEAAVGAVLANQLVVTYLPAIPGWFATEDLIRRDYL
jgi:undecaprenyl-diphosphatase